MLRQSRWKTALLLAAAACGGDGPTDPPPGPADVARVVVTPEAATLAVGDELRLAASAFDADGRPLADRATTWASTDAALARVSSDGRVVAVAPGSVRVAATVEGVPDTATITVTPVPARGLRLAPAQAQLVTGDTLALAATLTDGQGTPLPGRAVVWSQRAPQVLGLDGSGSTGRVIALAPGTDTVTVAGEGKSATAVIVVRRPPIVALEVADSVGLVAGDSLRPTATARDARGDARPDVEVTWQVADPGVARLTATGHLLAVAPGGTTLTATGGGVSASLPVGVRRATVVSIDVTPALQTLTGDTVALSAVARDAEGRPVDDAPLVWSSSDPAIARIVAGNRLAAVDLGEATLTAASDDARAAVTVTVRLGRVSRNSEPYCSPPGGTLLMSLVTPPNSVPRPVPVIVHVHGGAWIEGGRNQSRIFFGMRDTLVARGYAVASIDYRLAPENPWPSMIEDTRCAVRYLRRRAERYGFDPSRIGMWGESAGGQLAALALLDGRSANDDPASEHAQWSSRVGAAAVINPPTDLTRPGELDIDDAMAQVFGTWPDSTSSELRDASPVTHVKAGSPPLLIVMSPEDVVVAPAQQLRLRDAMLAVGAAVEVQDVVGANHSLEPTGTVPMSPGLGGVRHRIADFFERRLR